MRRNAKEGESLQRCPGCQGEVRGTLLQKVGEYRFCRCPLCGMRFSDPMRAADAEWYERSSVYGGRRQLKLPLAAYGLDWRYQTFLKMKLRKGGQLLDVGCGAGHFLRLARAHGYTVAGIDYDRESVQVARESFDLTDVHARSAGEPAPEHWNRRFDVITLFDVVEHLADPAGVLQGLKRILAPGGYVVCSVPSAERWPARFHPELDRPPHHLTLWTPAALRSCLSARGLTVRQIQRSPLRGADLLHSTESSVLPVVERIPVIGTAAFGASYLGATIAAAALRAFRASAGGFTLEAVAQAER